MSTVAVKIHHSHVTMSGDRQCGHESWGTHPATKVFRIREDLIGMVGEMGWAVKAIQWYKDGADSEKWPVPVEGNFCLVLWNDRDTILQTIDDDGNRVDIEAAYYALGSGAMAAMGAMAMGADTEQAIEVASGLDAHTGMGCDTISVTPKFQ